MFWSYAPKCVESLATAVEPAPQTCSERTAKVALAISTAIARALSADRNRRRTYRRSSSLCPWSPAAAALMPVLVP